MIRAPRASGALFALLCWFALPAAAEPQAVLPDRVERILAQHKLPSGSFSAFVQQVGSDKPLLAYNADVPRNPASVIKLVTTFAALEALGPTYQWRTEAYADGRISDGVLEGDLILKGYGDPYLLTERLWLLQRELRRQGIRQINGDLVIDNTWFAREDYDPAAFDGEGNRAYNVLPDALLVNFQAVNFIFRPEPQRGRVQILSDPSLPNVDIDNAMQMFRGECGSSRNAINMAVRDEGAVPRVVFTGNLANNCSEFQLLRSVLDAPNYAYGAFLGLWEEQGGAITGTLRLGTAPAGKKPLVRFDSPPLAEIIRPVNKFSNNVMTRQIFLTLGAEKYGAPGTRDKGRQAVEQALRRQGLEFPELVIANGAGLARDTRISARSLGQLLLAASASPFSAEFQASLSVAGLDGTTRRRFRRDPMAGQMHLKTGTLRDVTAIAGFVRSRSGNEYVVVAIANHDRATAGGGQSAQNALLSWVYGR